MRRSSIEHLVSQTAIREAANEIVNVLSLRMSDDILTAEQIREARASVEPEMRELILAVHEHVFQVSKNCLCPTYSPREIAQNFCITVDKVLGWIHSGRLEAIDVSSSQQGRRRYRVDADAIARFKAARSTLTEAAQPKRRRKRPRTKNLKRYV